MRVGKAANFENVLGALGKLFVDPDVLLRTAAASSCASLLSLTSISPAWVSVVMISAAMLSTFPGYSLILAAL